MKKTIGYVVTLIVIVFLLTACNGESNSNETHNDDTLNIYTTLFPIEDFVTKIGGEHVEVHNIITAGTDPHTYEPTTKMIVEIAKGDAFIYSGDNLETYADQISDAIETENVSILEASKGLEAMHHEHEEGKAHPVNASVEHGDDEQDDAHGHSHDVDPHVWLDPIRSIRMAENIKDALVRLKPESKDLFEQNFKDLENDLEELDSSFHEVINQAKSKQIVVSHEAYGYWEEAYGIEQIGLSGMNQSGELSQKEIKKVINQIEELNIRHILFEQNTSSNIGELVKQEVGAEALTIHNLSVRTHEETEQDEDYFSLMNQNLENLKIALNE
ncbi:metal ABC transporter solute-binding protein, Zn/Mn family [Salinibacillus xinjiangensis]|uniref:Adhesin n=1 Tax=Salinibacillus xinjiangensis TaxID=1229268 RepID=A0A6G1X4S1_9BACI|nr:zinc ABC transporter substrate-binding protein [Salinibacillus xinjiangensis]MRG85828.1 adhesin [Salinibacillus xinjiangensis]